MRTWIDSHTFKPHVYLKAEREKDERERGERGKRGERKRGGREER